MKIFNVRYGFATNSSSSHSLVFVPNNMKDVVEYSKGSFGWEWFFLTKKEDKLRYLAVRNQNNFPADFLESVLGFKPDGNSYIDHDSHHVLRECHDFEELLEEIEFLSNPKIGILGGNDNDDTPKQFKNLKEFPINDFLNGKYRKDGDVFVVFNSENGTKVRFSYNPDITTYNRSSAPELVDVKITDYCAMDCDYCYQGSTREGKHASLSDIKSIIDSLAEQQVFEIALGGGETTDHPDFIEIVEYAKEKGIVPNFTTRNTKWAKNEESVNRIISSIGKFAISVDSLNQLKKYYDTFKDIYVNYINVSDYMNAQIVMGVIEKEEFRNILKFCIEHYIPLTLLGYKTTGRGNNVIPIDYSWWLDVINEELEGEDYSEPLIGVDTEIIRLFRQKLIDNNIPEIFFTSIEGAFSCYIDAVEMKISKSSYEENKNEYYPFSKETWLKTYQNFELYDNIPMLLE